MLDDDDGVSFLDKAVQRSDKHLYVAVVKTSGGFVEDKHCRRLVLLCKERGEFDALALSAGKGGGGLPQLNIPDTYILERFEALYDPAALRILREELNRLIDGHGQDVVDRFAPVTDIEHVLFEAFAMAMFTFDGDVCHELHFDGDGTFSFALFASSARRVETEMGRCEAELLGEWLFGKEFANLVVRFEIGDGIRP